MTSLSQVRHLLASGVGTPLRAQLRAIIFEVWGATAVTTLQLRRDRRGGHRQEEAQGGHADPTDLAKWLAFESCGVGKTRAPTTHARRLPRRHLRQNRVPSPWMPGGRRGLASPKLGALFPDRRLASSLKAGGTSLPSSTGAGPSASTCGRRACSSRRRSSRP